MSDVVGAGINFLKARKTKEVPTELGTFLVRELGVRQMANTEGSDLVAQLAAVIVDEDGKQVFKTKEDMENLAEMPASVSTLIFKAVNELNGTSKEGQDAILKN